MAEDQLSEEEFLLWKTPCDSIKMFESWGFQTAAHAIAARLGSGLLKAAAETAIFPNSNSEREPSQSSLYAIPASHWANRRWVSNADFWKTSDLYLYDEFGSLRCELFGVRFNLDDLQSMNVNDAEAVSAERKEKRNPLSEAEAKKISHIILQFYGQELTEVRAFDLAKGMCPNNRVSRDPFLEVFRAIRGHKTPGKPRSNGK